jgi:hypothetical protein
MRTSRDPVNFPYTTAELEALFRYVHEHDVDRSRFLADWRAL